jgi:chromate transporter
LNLGIWFSLHTLFSEVNEVKYGLLNIPLPNLISINWGAFFITLIALFLYFRLNWDMLKTLGSCVVIGVLVYLFR